MNYDLAIAWNWEYDADFISVLEVACQMRGLSLLPVGPDSLARVLDDLHNRRIAVRVLLDRASDSDDAFHPLAECARYFGGRFINDRYLARRAWDKSTMHLEFIAAGIHTPYTIILPPFAAEPDPEPPDLSPIGRQFILKPAHGGGGMGVTPDLDGWAQIQKMRQEFATDKYLVQAMVTPRLTEAGPAWFRVLYAMGQVLPFWWDVNTHVYRPVTAAEETSLELQPLRDISRTIGRICRLDFFSTEIALSDPEGQFVSVDYVNDPIDLRPQSKACDGVPDDAVRLIADRIAEHVLLMKFR